MRETDFNSNLCVPIISVVIPTHQRPELLSKCLKALYRQSLSRKIFEIIVVHDGPGEYTKKKIIRLFPDVKFYSLRENKGPAAARNYGWLIAKGKLIAFTDDDCLPDKNWLRDILNEYAGEEAIAYSGKVYVPLSLHPTDFELYKARLATDRFITANCVCTKAALLKVGGFDERFRMAWREDSDLEFKLLSEQITIRKLSNALVVRPVRKAPWGISIKEQRKGMFNALLYKKFPFLYREKIDESPSLMYYLMVILFSGMVFGLFTGQSYTVTITLVAYLILLLWFTLKRLKNTSRRIDHIAEIIVTSPVIPFACIYWQWYGAYKFKVLFI